MNVSNNNLKFEYLYRDAGNYKQFGQLIFSNPTHLDLKTATSKIREKLIDTEFFYPAKVGVPHFNKIDFDLNCEWYEFLQFSSTDENPTEKIDIESFIEKFVT